MAMARGNIERPELAAPHADASMKGEAPRREVVTVRVSSVRPGQSPRLAGEDRAHIARLAETEGPLPPILVDRHTMQVIDGIHRLRAASLKGQESIEVEFFDGSPADAFLRSVEANVTHGLPLSRADRRAAAARIVALHPHMSDRAIGESAGLAAKTVAAIRRRSTAAAPQLTARIGKDGRVRPLNSAQGRERAAELLARHPEASLREVARAAGISPATVGDVRRRLQQGQEPAPARAGEQPAEPRRASGPGRPRAVPPVPAAVLEKLLRDPALRRNDQGRRLLRLLQANASAEQELPVVITSVPPYCVVLVAQLARHYGRMWQRFAQELHGLTLIIEAQDRSQVESQN
jgi:ParB-like chromosome segregation protein Spo0J